ncbi:MAG TPA: RodZ domain-containing protein, partial [Alphaproteobacteria bacterium]
MARRKQRVESEASIEPIIDAGAAVRGVGATLREARERRGWNIPEIAQQLRIRPAVLEAMEAGRFEKLPNGAYALGFVRSYADFLGLDRDEIARRVKAEAAALNARTELVFPTPLRESRMPSGVVLLVSIGLAITGYGLWYYNSSGVRVAAPRVDAVPERLGGVPERAGKSPRDAEAATVPAPATTEVVPERVEPRQPEIKPDTAAMPPPVQPPMSAAPAVPPVVPPSPSLAVAPPPVAPAAAPATTSEPQTAAIPASPSPASTPSMTSSDVKPPAQARQFGDTDNARIVIKTTADSWVQIRDQSGAVVFSRILRPGDSFGVSNRPGQTLTSGSAGVLDIMVDGKKAPTIGRPGFTQHDVPLDPTRLLAGTAVTESPRAARPQ